MDTSLLAKKIRLHCLNMTHLGQGSHIGSCFSVADIVAALYGQVLNLDPQNPKLPTRDRFILSKGHAGAAVYAALAERGFFPIEQLDSHYQDGSNLMGHISHKGVSGVELSTGSLGHGLPVAVGMAYAAMLENLPQRVFVLMSDGEFDEGSNWEALLFAAHHRLSNLSIIIDYNKIQSLDSIANTLGLEPFRQKLEAFNWHVKEVDGHDHESLIEACSTTASSQQAPVCIIANTIKGKGVSFMEHSVLWHYRSPQGEEFQQALAELERA